MCGEKPSSNCCLLITSGSPPRVRGKVMAIPLGALMQGITPACAGKSLRFLRACLRRRDHPRVCGEKITLHMRAKVALGSPPRMRGKAWRVRHWDSTSRITPAYAGKSWERKSTRASFWDHPRVCGEKLRTRCPPGGWPGSPPRMRGKELQSPD